MSAEVTPRPKSKRKKPYASTAQNKRVATDMHARLVRAWGRCEWGGRYPDDSCEGRLECAHIIRRRYAATRTDVNNALCLCAKHHRYVDSHLAALITFVGLHEYQWLQAKADAGIAATGMSPLVFWRAERERLTALAKARGLA